MQHLLMIYLWFSLHDPHDLSLVFPSWPTWLIGFPFMTLITITGFPFMTHMTYHWFSLHDPHDLSLVFPSWPTWLITGFPFMTYRLITGFSFKDPHDLSLVFSWWLPWLITGFPSVTHMTFHWFSLGDPHDYHWFSYGEPNLVCDNLSKWFKHSPLIDIFIIISPSNKDLFLGWGGIHCPTAYSIIHQIPQSLLEGNHGVSSNLHH